MAGGRVWGFRAPVHDAGGKCLTQSWVVLPMQERFSPGRNTSTPCASYPAAPGSNNG